MVNISIYSSTELLQYVLLITFLFSVGMAIGYMQKASRALFGSHLPPWAPVLSRFLFFLYAVGALCYGIWVLAEIYEKVDLTLLFFIAVVEYLYLFILPCTACSVIERKLVFPWTFLSPSFHSRDPKKGGEA